MRGLARLFCWLAGHDWQLRLHAEGRDGFICRRCQAMRVRSALARS